ncbi:MAG: OmpP1/FadL family transporter [Deltaproteobacteria bacterium]|nr:OmpP1/FadL family transporter [Deltaproteobacteria bacterium]
MKRQMVHGLIRVLCTVAFALVFAGGTARAGGIGLYEFGSPDVGLAAAGYAARAQDASTVFTNPAGMSCLDKSQVLGGLQGLYGDVGFSPNSGSTVSGSDGGNAIGWAPGGSIFATQKLNKDWSIGFGVLSYFGLSEKYDDNWVGRYYVQKSSLIGLTLTPAVSYRVNDWFSVGAGLNMMYGYIDDQVAVNNIVDSRPDGQLKYKDTKWGYGGNFGILVEPTTGTRFGLTYLTEVKLDFSAVPEFSGLGPILQSQLNQRGLTTNNLDMNMTVPQMVMLSGNHDLNEKWSILGNVGWQNWSRFGEVEIGVNSTNPQSLTVNSDYKDTWHVALGTQYRHSQAWTFTGGIAYDSSAVDDDKRSVVVPMGEAWRFAMGAQYALTQDIKLGAAYEFIWGGDMSVDQYRGPLAGTVSGDFNSANFSVLALNIIWKY